MKRHRLLSKLDRFWDRVPGARDFTVTNSNLAGFTVLEINACPEVSALSSCDCDIRCFTSYPESYKKLMICKRCGADDEATLVQCDPREELKNLENYISRLDNCTKSDLKSNET